MYYDYDGRMTEAIGDGENDSDTVLSYDALGRQTGRAVTTITAVPQPGGGYQEVSSTVTTSYQYDGGMVLTEKQGTSTTATYTYGNALIRKDGETPLFDGLGSERTVTDSTGSVTASQSTDAFGGAVASSGGSSSSYQFGATSGYRTDGDGSTDDFAGLVKVGCRYYDTDTGRFTTRDTDLSQKAYLHCEANPANFTDPSRHDASTKGG